MKYRVKSRLDHDGQAYLEGDHVELDEAQAAPLLAVDVVEAVATTGKKPKKDDGGDAPPAPGDAAAEGA